MGYVCHRSDENIQKTSSKRRFRINSGPQLNFLASGDLGSTTRQNGATSSKGAPAARSSNATSAMIRRKIPVVRGHVASAPCRAAKSARISSGLRVFPGAIFLTSASSSFGVEMRSFAPAGTPHMDFDIVSMWGSAVVSYFSRHVFLAMAHFGTLLTPHCPVG